MKRLCVYCGANPGAKPEYMEAARQLGQELVKRNIDLVYGGASVGIMGEIADTVLAQGGEVIGVIPQALVDKEVSHNGLTELIVVKSMHERKAVMADHSDGFIAMPGGLGTMEELFEVLTWAQLGFHNKPCSLLNVLSYYDPLIQFIDHAVEQQFIRTIHRGLLLTESEPADLLDALENYQPSHIDKWISRDET